MVNNYHSGNFVRISSRIESHMGANMLRAFLAVERVSREMPLDQ